MTTEEVFKYLVRECGLTFAQCLQLDDYQISKILCRPDRPPKRL